MTLSTQKIEKSVTVRYRSRREAERQTKAYVDAEISWLQRLWQTPPEYWEKYYTVFPPQYLKQHKWSLIVKEKTMGISIAINSLVITVFISFSTYLLGAFSQGTNIYSNIIASMISTKNSSTENSKLLSALKNINVLTFSTDYKLAGRLLFVIILSILLGIFMYHERKRKLEMRILIIESMTSNDSSMVGDDGVNK